MNSAVADNADLQRDGNNRAWNQEARIEPCPIK